MATISLKCKECGRETRAEVQSPARQGLECSYCGEIFPSGEIRAAFDRSQAASPPTPRRNQWNALFKD